MSVDRPDVVDAVGIDRVSGEVVLTIADPLEWDESGDHVLLLQEKVNRYFGFIESGELLQRYPDAADRPVRIDVCCRYGPSAAGRKLLAQAGAVAAEYGSILSWRVVECEPDATEDGGRDGGSS